MITSIHDDALFQGSRAAPIYMMMREQMPAGFVGGSTRYVVYMTSAAVSARRAARLHDECRSVYWEVLSSVVSPCTSSIRIPDWPDI